MSNTQSVSVVLGTYNGERYLTEQLASLSAQALPPVELVVGDDGSSDSTVALVKEFARSSPFPVRLIQRNERLGFADNFLTTAQSAVGSLLAFCDQDDTWHPDKLAKVVDTFSQSPEVVAVAHDADLVAADGRPIQGQWSSGSRLAGRHPRGVPNPPPCGCTLTVRSWLLDWADPALRPQCTAEHAKAGETSLMYHDHWLWMLATCMGDRVVLPDRLMSYRRNDTSFFGSLPRTSAGRLLKDLDSLFPFLRPENMGEFLTRVSDSRVDQADYLDHMADLWAEKDHREWSAAARSYSAELRQQGAAALDRARLFRMPNRRTAAAHWAEMVFSRRYDRPRWAVMDALRILQGPAPAPPDG